LASAVHGHSGPPYPLLMDQPAGGHTVSVWADPDIGQSSFFIVLEGAPERPVGGEPTVAVWVEPVSGRLAKATYEARRQDLRGRRQYLASPDFDRQEPWRVGIVIRSEGADPIELRTEVVPTPDGVSPLHMALYAFPFLLLAGFWIAAQRRKWRLTRA
jgi:hypothetical protein